MGDLRRWITAPSESGVATRLPATSSEKPQKTAPLQVATPRLPVATRSVQVASRSHPPATRTPAENRQKSAQVAGSRVAGSENETPLPRPRLRVAPDLPSQTDLLVFLHELAADFMASDVPEVEADALAFDKLLWIWSAGNPGRPVRNHCAACGAKLAKDTLMLADGAVVCDSLENQCLIAYGIRRRREAVKALAGVGLHKPNGWQF